MILVQAVDVDVISLKQTDKVINDCVSRCSIERTKNMSSLSQHDVGNQ